jgi:hypothetical protein
MIHRAKTHGSPSSPHTPSSQWGSRRGDAMEWSSVEDLLQMSGGLDWGSDSHTLQGQDALNFLQRRSTTVQRSALVHSPPVQGFAQGGQVMAAPATTSEATEVTTIEAPTSNSDNSPSDIDIEPLAQQVYQRLQRRLERERERVGSFNSRMAW